MLLRVFSPCKIECTQKYCVLLYLGFNGLTGLRGVARILTRQGADQNYNRLFCAKLFGFSNVKNSFTLSGKVACQED